MSTGLKRLGAERHRRDRLHAAQHVDLVGAAEMHRRDRLGMRAALVRRRAGGDVADPGDPRGDDRHMRRGDHRIAPARHIAADPADRDVAVAEHDPGQGLDLDILHRGALDLGEVADLRLREFDVVDRLRRDLGDQAADLVRRTGESSAATICRSARDSSRTAASPRVRDIGDDGLDRAAGLGVGFFLLAGERGGLDVPGHGSSFNVPPRRHRGHGDLRPAFSVLSVPPW